MKGRVALCVLGAALLWPAQSQAVVACSFAGGTVTATSNQSDQGVSVVRVGNEIRVLAVSAFGLGPNVVVPCAGGPPTVLNTDSVKLEEAATVSFGTMSIDLGGGPFAPGATAEPDGVSEIEFVVSMPGRDGFFDVRGGSGPDSIQLGRIGPGANAIDVNSVPGVAADPEIQIGGTEFVGALGGKGRDMISGRGGLGFAGPFRGFLFLGGERGRDRLFSGRGLTDLSGGAGRDRLAGSADPDFLAGGAGGDLLIGRGSRDFIFAFAGGRDRINCGGGRDDGFSDRRDRERGCERLSHKDPFAKIKKQLDEVLEEILPSRTRVPRRWGLLTSK